MKFVIRRHLLPFNVILLLFLSAGLACSEKDTGPVINHEKQTPASRPEEHITINGDTYLIPSPWQGNKVDAPELRYEDFKKIPEQFCRDGGKVYVTIETQQHLVTMLTKALEDGILIQVESGYRSASYQKKIFKRMLAAGRTFDDIVRYVAPPGYSNHMLGTAVDFSPSNWRFAETKQYQWLREHAAQFGFEETYSKNNPLRIPWESWHWQFVGLPPKNNA